MKTLNITQEEFLTKIADYQNNPTGWKYLGDIPAIVEFYFSWCGHCQQMAPILEKLAEEYDG